MAKKRIGILNLDSTIEKILADYGEDAYKVLDKSVDRVAQEATDKLKAVQFKTGGEYSKSWVADKEPSGRFATKVIIHNEEHYRLTHLLEKGHVVRNGRSRITGESYGRTNAYPHIAPVEEWAKEELPREVERELK